MEKNTSLHHGWIPSCGSGLSLGAPPRLPATAALGLCWHPLPRSGPHRPPLTGLGRWSSRSGLQAPLPRIPLRPRSPRSSSVVMFATCFCRGLEALRQAHRTRTPWPAAAIPSRGTAGPSGRGGAGAASTGAAASGPDLAPGRSPPAGGPAAQARGRNVRRAAPRRAAHARSPATTTGSTSQNVPREPESAERPPRAHRLVRPVRLGPAAPLPPPSAPAATRPHKSPRRRRRRPEVPGPRLLPPHPGWQLWARLVFWADVDRAHLPPSAGAPMSPPAVPWILSAWPARACGGGDRDGGVTSPAPGGRDEPRAPSPDSPSGPRRRPRVSGLTAPPNGWARGAAWGAGGWGGLPGGPSPPPPAPRRAPTPRDGLGDPSRAARPPRGRYGGGGWGLGAGSWPGALEQLQPALGPPGMRERAAHQDFYGNLLLEAAAAAAAAAARGLPAAGAAAARAPRAPGPPRAPQHPEHPGPPPTRGRRTRTAPPGATRTPAGRRVLAGERGRGAESVGRERGRTRRGRGPRGAGRGLRGETRPPDPASAVCPRLGRGGGAALPARAPSLGDFGGGAPHPEPRGDERARTWGPAGVGAVGPPRLQSRPARPPRGGCACPSLHLQGIFFRRRFCPGGGRELERAQDLVPCIAEPQRNCVATSPWCGVCHPIRRQIAAP
eukprot:XP_013969938.1 collagen alpha-1(I) chain-like [Canis lupus familiaris]